MNGTATNHFMLTTRRTYQEMGQSTMRGGGGLRPRAVSQEQDHYAPLFKEEKMADSQNLKKHPPAGHSYSCFSQNIPTSTIGACAHCSASCSPVLFTDERQNKLNSKNKVTLIFPRLQDWSDTLSCCLLSQSVFYFNFQEVVETNIPHPCIVFFIFIYLFILNLFHVGCVLQAPEVPTAASTVTVTWDLSSGLYSPLNTTSTPSMKTECTPKPI